MTSETGASSPLRQEFLSFLQRGDSLRAIQAARALLQQEMGIRQWSFIRAALDNTPERQLSLKPLRVALLSSFSIDFIHPALIAYGFVNKLKPVIYQSNFSQFRQEILDPNSSLYSFSPDAVVLAVEGKHWFPLLYHSSSGSNPHPDAALREGRDEVAALISAFRQHSQAPLLIHNFAPPIWPQLGIADGREGIGQTQLVHRLNDTLQELARENPGVHIVDYAGLVSRHGALHWYDERMDQYAKAPIAQTMLGHLSAEYMKYFRGLTGQAKKCLVLDLDNTLWGGVVGEEGIHGIQLGPDYPGSAFVAFQKTILNLRDRGVILAVASKNNPADIEEVLVSHPHMVLRKEHFSILQVNWAPKSDSLRHISEQLGVGLEHMVVVDDNPAECSEIQRALPMIVTITLPRQPELYARALLEEGLFDSLSVSSEDRRRGELYQQRAQAQALHEQSGSLEDYYRSLAMEVTFAPVDGSTLARAAQLTQKTNQFNVTAIRYSEAQLQRLMADPDWQLVTVGVRDRFGDNGLVGLVFLHTLSSELEIDTLLLSCRVIGRTIETAMLAHLCNVARRLGIRTVRGRVLPTARNLPARDVFAKHGFHKLAESEVETIWVLDVEQDPIANPVWIHVCTEVRSPESCAGNVNPIGVEHAGSS